MLKTNRTHSDGKRLYSGNRSQTTRNRVFHISILRLSIGDFVSSQAAKNELVELLKVLHVFLPSETCYNIFSLVIVISVTNKTEFSPLNILLHRASATFFEKVR